MKRAPVSELLLRAGGRARVHKGLVKVNKGATFARRSSNFPRRRSAAPSTRKWARPGEAGHAPTMFTGAVTQSERARASGGQSETSGNPENITPPRTSRNPAGLKLTRGFKTRSLARPRAAAQRREYGAKLAASRQCCQHYPRARARRDTARMTRCECHGRRLT